MRGRKSRIAVTLATVALSAGVAAGPASAQTNQDGLVNVAATDTVIQVPIGVAANICGVGVAALSQGLQTGTVDCTAIAGATATSTGNSNGGPTRQNGLVNIALTDTTVQIPVTAAANICGVGVGVLAQFINTDDVACTARSRGSAQG